MQISREKIGNLYGTSRQRYNQALQRLEKRGLIRVESGDVTVLDVEGLARLRHVNCRTSP